MLIFRLYFGETHPDTGTLYIHLGTAQQHLGKSKEALETLNKADTVLMISYGDKYSLVRKSLEPYDVINELCAIN